MSDSEQCDATQDLQIGNQIPQTARCIRDTTPHTRHQAMVLDSDDNWITHRWSS